MKWPWSKRGITLEELRDELADEIAKLRNVMEAAIKRYTCIICNAEFARLPGQSDKRCSHCQALIKETTAISSGNSGHRGPGHNTRGIHKTFGGK